jgi:dephospho-CoA kinase
VGVTGAIGSGKSLLCRILAHRHGCPVIDADHLGHLAIGRGGAARDEVVALFGATVLDGEGDIDRARLAVQVFSDPAALAALASATHPVILEEVARQVVALKASGYAGIILLDAAVLPEWIDRLRPDAVVMVRATPEARRHRLEARGLGPEDVRRRIAAQEQLFSEGFRADQTIDNNDTTESLDRAAEALWRTLAARFGAPERSSSP